MIIKEKISQERWQRFSKKEQMMHIKAEIARAKNWQNQDKSKFLSALERALELIDSSLDDNRWQDQRSMLFWLREQLSKFYLGRETHGLEVLCAGL